MSSFPCKVPTQCLDSTVSPLRLRWVKDVCMCRCNLPSALLAEWSGSFTCHCGNTGVERTPNESQHIKLALEKNILPPLLQGLELATFRSRVWRSINKPSIDTAYTWRGKDRQGEKKERKKSCEHKRKLKGWAIIASALADSSQALFHQPVCLIDVIDSV